MWYIRTVRIVRTRITEPPVAITVYFYLVLSLVILAALIPHLDLMISLIGAFASSALALIFPPMIEIITLWPDELGTFKWRLIKDIVIVIFGLIGFVTGTVTTVIRIIETF